VNRSKTSELIAEFCRLGTWMPPEFMIATSMVPIHACAGTSFFTRVSVKTYFAAEYYMLVGDVSTGKTIAIEDVTKPILMSVDPQLILGKDFTPEGLLNTLVKRSRGVVLNDELSLLFSKREFNKDMGAIWTTLYNHVGDYFRDLKKEQYHIRQPGLCGMVGAQPQILASHVGQEDFARGLMARFIVCAGEKQKENLDAAWNEVLFREIVTRLRAINLVSRVVVRPIGFTIDRSAKELVNKAAEKFKEQENEDVGAYYARIEDHIYKLALTDAIDTWVTTHCLDAIIAEVGEELMSDIYNLNYLTNANPLMQYSMNTTWKGDKRPMYSPQAQKIRAKAAEMPLYLGASLVHQLIQEHPPSIEKANVEFAILNLTKLVQGQKAALMEAGGSIDMKLYHRILRAMAEKKYDDEQGKWYVRRGDIQSKLGMVLRRLEGVLLWMEDRGILSGVEHYKRKGRKGREEIRYEILTDPALLLRDEKDGWE